MEATGRRFITRIVDNLKTCALPSPPFPGFAVPENFGVDTVPLEWDHVGS